MWFWIKAVEVVVLCAFAIYFDIKKYKIKNEIIIAGIVSGILTNVLSNAIDGVVDSLLGLIIPVAVLFLLFALKMLGAGDIKLFSAIGAIMGWKFIIHSMIVSILLGGFIAVIIIVLRKNAVERLKYLFNYLKCCLITIKVHEYQELDKGNKGLFRFSYAVAGGTIITLIFYDYLVMF
ncbi:MAG TPA: prepilin peptidase [Clostridia bacterium]|nr:prepilin peptidase [Clostridia bacterium]